jgi:hypothetical protein
MSTWNIEKEDNTRMDLREGDCGDGRWNELAQNRDHWSALY